MLRTDLIKMLILDEMADDYENLYQIKMGVLRAGMDCGLTIAPPEIASALADLLADGFVQAYRLYPSPVREIPNSIPVANLADGGPYRAYLLRSEIERLLLLSNFERPGVSPEW